MLETEPRINGRRDSFFVGGSRVFQRKVTGFRIGYTVVTPMSFNRPLDPEQRERLKQQQREARAKRKEAMAADPRVQAMKQAQKDRRRTANEAAKARRKEATAERKQRERDKRAEDRAQGRASLQRRVRPATTDEK